MENILEVKNLKTYFHQDDRVIRAVDDVSFSIEKNSVLGVVGESGCGKTMTALSLTRLLPGFGCKIVSGSVLFEGHDLINLSEDKLRQVRGRDISYVFQEPTTSLNPVLSVKEQIEEVLLVHRPDIEKEKMHDFIIEHLEIVGIRQAEEKIFSYPHQLSGGEKQRVMIAMALVSNPKLLIADEPTTALDVTIQAQILLLLRDLKEKFGLSIMFISHDLNVIAQVSDCVCVMYAGQVVELSNTQDLVHKPQHPYTQGLIACLPGLVGSKGEKLNEIAGEVPREGNFPKGCRFHPRCPKAFGKCSKEMPPLFEKGKNSEVRCWLYSN